MNNIIKKIILAALSLACVLATFPMNSAFAQDENPPKEEVSVEKLERVWAHQLKTYKRIGRGFENTDTKIAKFQARIDKADANGKDVTALQSAFDAFASALKNAKPTYDSIGVIVSLHQGFDANGKVIDAELAKSTVQGMRTKMHELKSAMGGTGKALREAIKAFRDVNKPSQAPTERDS
jgi:hypothetical protein